MTYRMPVQPKLSVVRNQQMSESGWKPNLWQKLTSEECGLMLVGLVGLPLVMVAILAIFALALFS